MPAYLIVEHKITDAEKFDQNRIAVGPMIAKHGGRYLTKGGSHKFPEGGHWLPERVVIIEFRASTRSTPGTHRTSINRSSPCERAAPAIWTC